MANIVTEIDRIALASAETPFCLELDGHSGLPVGLSTEAGSGVVRWPIHCTARVEVGGTEKRDPTGGIAYEGTVSLTDLVLRSTDVRTTHAGTFIAYELDATMGPLDVTLQYWVFPQSPYLEMRARLSSSSGAEVVIRQAVFEIVSDEPSGGGWLVNAPGNGLRRDVPIAQLGDTTLGISPVGGLRGSGGVIAVTDADGHSLTIWPNAVSEVIQIGVDFRAPGTIVTTVTTELAAALAGSDAVDLRITCLDLQVADFAEITAQWQDWLARYGFTSPPSKPDWVRTASLYEVQVGTSVFWGGHSYTRYPRVADVLADLDRIEALGFSVLQMMPKQPYPSYNVHDYFDIDTSYGDRSELQELVQECHRRGMRVILDVLLHGVLDKESIDAAVQGVKDGPLFERLSEETGDCFAADVSDWDNYLLAWSRHILDFGPHWSEGSPDRTDLEDTHPEWFYRDSAGHVTSVYTKAFDARSASWQRYFRTAMISLLEGLDIDGFRFDAPTYNNFANWAPWARHRASASPLGCVSLFVDLRRDIKRSNPDAMMYTEPSGHLLRRSMDLNYNYDEQWLVTALADPGSMPPRAVRTAREFAQWMQDRDAFLPHGSQTAHHIDSHDTFWWPEWGKKWRREQFPIGMVRALTAAFISVDGPYMMFTGGEEGVEDLLAAFNGSRRRHPDLWARTGEFVLAPGQDEQLLHIRRVAATGEVLDVIVNIGQESPVSFALEADRRARTAGRALLRRH